MDNEKVVIYSNYKRTNKWLGIIDYKSLTFLSIYIVLVISIIRVLPIKLEYLIYILIILTVPIIAILLVNIGNESAIDMLIILIKHYFNNKTFVKKGYINKNKNQVYIKNK